MSLGKSSPVHPWSVSSADGGRQTLRGSLSRGRREERDPLSACLCSAVTPTGLGWGQSRPRAPGDSAFTQALSGVLVSLRGPVCPLQDGGAPDPVPWAIPGPGGCRVPSSRPALGVALLTWALAEERRDEAHPCGRTSMGPRAGGSLCPAAEEREGQPGQGPRTGLGSRELRAPAHLAQEMCCALNT